MPIHAFHIVTGFDRQFGEAQLRAGTGYGHIGTAHMGIAHMGIVHLGIAYLGSAA
jgi:hypothetical protein